MFHSKIRAMFSRFKKFMMILLSVVAIAICAIFGWYFLLGGETWIAYTWHDAYELPSFAKETSTKAIYTDQQIEEILTKYEWLDDHYDISRVIQDSYVIPGLKASVTLEDWNDNTAGPSICTSMTPQGVALTDDYLLISAYCHTGRHHSVIQVVNRHTHEFVRTVVLFDKSHVGSVTYDSDHDIIWVCCHDDSTGYAYVRGFTSDALEVYDFEDGQPITFTYNYPIKSQKRASFMTYDNNALYIGYFSKDMEGEFSVQRFDMNGDGTLLLYPNVDKKSENEPDSVALPTLKEVINGGMQGYARNDHSTVILRSYGSSNPSSILLFDIQQDDIGMKDLTDSNARQIGTLPAMAEEAALDGDDLYICFESAAYAYRARKTDHIDRILVLKAYEDEN